MRPTQCRILAAACLLASLSFGVVADGQTARFNFTPAARSATGDAVTLEQLAAEVARQADEIDRLREQVQDSQFDEVSYFDGRTYFNDADYFDGEPLSFRGKWDFGLWFETANGNFRANIGGRVEEDWVWFDIAPQIESVLGRAEDGWFFRRARIHGAGTIYGFIDLFAEFEAAPVDNIVFQDMWGQLRNVPLLGNVRAGHVKVPLGLENYTSAKYVTFMERSAVHDAFQQEYDPGLMAWNTAFVEQATWSMALLRLDPLESGRAFGNGRYSGSGRMTAVPFSTEDDHLLLHLGGGYRYDNGGVPNPLVGTDTRAFRARPELRNTPRFVDTGPLIVSGVSTMLFESAVVVGPFSAQAEYTHTTAHNASIPGGPDLGDAVFDGYYVYLSYFLTGETRPYSRKRGTFGRIMPFVNVRPGEGSMLRQGAWETSIRFSRVNLNDTGIEGGVLQTVTAGLTWYMNPNTKMLINYIWADRDVAGTAQDGDANLFGMRFHISF